MSKKQGFKGSLRRGEKEFTRRNPVTSAKMRVTSLKSHIALDESMGWNCDEWKAQLVEAEKKLKEVLASGVKDEEYDKDGNLKRRME